MKVAYQQLARHLQGQLSPIYLISGDEPLLVGEGLEQIRAAAREAGFLERSLYVVDRGFRWVDLESAADNLSLFASKKLLELRLNSPRPGDSGAKAIRALAENTDPDQIVLIGIMAKLDASAARSAWVKSVDKHGTLIDVRPVSRNDLPRWISGRAKAVDLVLTRAAAELLADRVEGNLLAADQEIRKLALTASGKTIDEQAIQAAVANSARFDVFRLSDAILSGDALRALRVLSGLKSDGTAPALVSWALIREVTLLTKLAVATERGVSLDQAMREAGVWQSRQGLVKRALRRFKRSELTSLLAKAAEVDATVKGARYGRPWDALTDLVLAALRPRAGVVASG